MMMSMTCCGVLPCSSAFLPLPNEMLVVLLESSAWSENGIRIVLNPCDLIWASICL